MGIYTMNIERLNLKITSVGLFYYVVSNYFVDQTQFFIFLPQWKKAESNIGKSKILIITPNSVGRSILEQAKPKVFGWHAIILDHYSNNRGLDSYNYTAF